MYFFQIQRFFNSHVHLLIDRWEGEGLSEVGKDKKTGAVRVKVNPKFFRPTEVVSTSSLVMLSVLQVGQVQNQK